MSNMFLRQQEASEYAQGLEDPIEHVLAQASLSAAIGCLVADPGYRESWSSRPFDLLLFTRAAHALLRNKGALRGILAGDIPNCGRNRSIIA